MRQANVTSTLSLPLLWDEKRDKVCIRVLDGPLRDSSAIVERGTLLAGSSPECDLCLEDRTISRRHATFEVLEGRVRVTDMGSKNGTFYHGVRFSTLELPVGAVIQLGNTKLVLAPMTENVGVSERTEVGGLVGCSLRTRAMFAEIERLAPTELAVLVSGETGCGKEGVARALHTLSTRNKGPFTVFECSSVHGELVHSALFGHVRGAFTGANSDFEGALAESDGGTLFLDEVAELPPSLQPLLLRVLETGVYRRVGDTVDRKADFRLLAATHQDLEVLVQKGTFRADLYYRIAAYTLKVPPLRERLDDIPMLVRHLTGESLPPDSLLALCGYHWPGNVRELRNVLQRRQAIGPEALTSEAPSTKGGFLSARAAAVNAFSKMYLESLVERHRHDMSAAAREAGIATSYLYKLLVQHGLARGKKGQRFSDSDS